jgi:carbon-monoxide dehydrogenase large subunit
VQGVGQALQGQCFYDAKTGQLLSGSFMDYAMPRSDGFPFFDTSISEVPTPAHPLGNWPAGEGGTTPALTVMVNAIVDALRDFGVARGDAGDARANLARPAPPGHWQNSAAANGRRQAD